MAALLSSRTALIARSTSISTGAIVGATIGSVIGALLIFFCALPFILRARRLRAFRRQHGDDAPVDEIGHFPGAPDFLSRSHFGDAFRRLSHSAPAEPPSETCRVGDGQESTDQNPESIEKPQTSLYPAGVSGHYGLPSPMSPPLPTATKSEPLPGRSIQEGRTATGSLTLATQTTQDSFSADMLSHESTVTEAATSLTNQSGSDSFFPPSRQGTFGSKGMTEEPESVPGKSRRIRYHARRPPSHISESVRHFAQLASSAVGHGSIRSTGSLRSVPVSPSDDIPHVASAPAAFEPVDTDAPGEAYSYYHGFDAVPEPRPVPEQAASYGPPVTIPAPAPLPTSTFTSPTSASTVTPISPVSPIRPSVPLPAPSSTQALGFAQRGVDNANEEPEDSGLKSRGRRGPGDRLERMNTQPLKPIVSDIPSPPLPVKSEASVNPMDIWGPTTKTEQDWMVQQELVKMSTPSPPTRLEGTPPMELFPSQPTPEQTPGPESALVRELEMEDEPELELKQEPDSQIFLPPPDIAINGGDIEMETSGWSTPPPSSVASNLTSPNQTPDSRPTPGHYIATPSPQSNVGGNDQPDASPRLYKCDDCDRVFDQYHKLNHHTRYHDRPHLCEHPNCGKRFGTKTHLDRHINDKHTQTRKYFCTQHNCPYSRQGGKSFPRKDNWRRHMINKHNIENPAEPTVDYRQEVVMGGTGQPSGF